MRIITSYTISPMFIIEMIAEKYNEKIISLIDNEYNVCVYINNIDRISKKKYLSNIEGRGLTYRDACIDYIEKALDPSYCIRYKKEYYATTPIRKIIKTYMSIIKQKEENENV